MGHRLKRWLGSPAIILMYHRVTELTNDPNLLAVTPDNFARHLEAIRAYGTPIPLRDLVQSVRQGRVPARAVALTFDDGYADNLHHAKPLLVRYRVPATVFITAGQINGAREFWWDDLDRLLLQPGTLPPVLRLPLDGGMREWRLDEASTYTAEDYQHHRHWHLECQDDPGPRQRLFRGLFELLHAVPPEQRQTLLAELAAWAEAPALGRPSHRPLTTEETLRLADGDLVEVGAHTMSHPVLATLPASVQRWEIQQSKASLEAMLGRVVESFAYPHGSSTPATVAHVAEAGFLCACSSRTDNVFRGADPYHLPRLGVRNWDGQAFARWLRWWGGGPAT